MNIKVHYLITLCALFFLGVLISNPNKVNSGENERSCKLVKGRMDCFNKFTEYKINNNTEVSYKLN